MTNLTTSILPLVGVLALAIFALIALCGTVYKVIKSKLSK